MSDGTPWRLDWRNLDAYPNHGELRDRWAWELVQGNPEYCHDFDHMVSEGVRLSRPRVVELGLEEKVAAKYGMCFMPDPWDSHPWESFSFVFAPITPMAVYFELPTGADILTELTFEPHQALAKIDMRWPADRIAECIRGLQRRRGIRVGDVRPSFGARFLRAQHSHQAN